MGKDGCNDELDGTWNPDKGMLLDFIRSTSTAHVDTGRMETRSDLVAAKSIVFRQERFRCHASLRRSITPNALGWILYGSPATCISLQEALATHGLP